MATLKDLSRQLTQLQKQIPFATAQAISPTPFTVNAVGSSGARKNNLRAKVYVRDIAAEYLKPFKFGGNHKLNSQALLNPPDQ